jgi:hypothetical protein
MSARILVTSGITAGHRHWIDQAVLRIGSDSACAIVVPSLELAGHAATLEYRNGQYFVHNKSSIAHQIDRRPLPPNSSSVWAPGQGWSLAPDVVLVLEVEGDPAPSLPPNTEVVTDIDAVTPGTGGAAGNSSTAATAEASGKSSSNAVQIGIIVLCVLGCVFLLLRDKMPGKGEKKRNLPTFSQLVEENRETMPEEVRMLQFARSLVVRNRADEARDWYRKLRDRLLARQEQQADKQSSPMLDYVLAQLERK